MFALFAKNQLGFDIKQAGYFLALVGLLGVIWRGGLIGPIVKRFGEHKSLMIGLVASAAGLLYYIVAVDVWWKLIFVAILFSFGHSVSRPSLTSLIAHAAPPNRRGGVFGAMTSISVTRIIGPVLRRMDHRHAAEVAGVGRGAFFTVAALIGWTIRSGEARRVGRRPARPGSLNENLQ